MKRERKHFVPLPGDEQFYVIEATQMPGGMEMPPPKTRGRIVNGRLVPEPKPDATPKTETDEVSPQNVEPPSPQ